MGDAILEKFYYNGESLRTAEFDEKYKALTPSVYEVIRVMEGRPLFLSEHYARLLNSAKTVGGRVPFSKDEFFASIEELCAENGVKNHNVKLVMNGVAGGEFANIYLFMIKTSYPTEEMYAAGVRTDLFNAVRNNPNAKIIDADLRRRENEFMAEKNIFEAILVNGSGEATEGSRSNIFFIRGGEVYTAPGKDVLLGVTRQRVIRICKEHGLRVHETPIGARVAKAGAPQQAESMKADSAGGSGAPIAPGACIADFEAAFISGTSPKVLPIACIGDLKLDVQNPTLRSIMQFYDEEITKDLSL